MLVASLFAIFAIPIFLVVKERPMTDATPFRVADALGSWRQLGVTWQHAGGSPVSVGSSSAASSTPTGSTPRSR